MTTVTDPNVDLGIEEITTVRFRVNAQGIQATRKFRLSDAADFETFMASLFGEFFVTTGDTIPGQLGAYPGIPRLVVDELNVEPFDESVGSAERLGGVADPVSGQVVTVNYKTHQWDRPSPSGLPEPGTTVDLPGSDSSHPASQNPILVTHRVSVGGEMIEIPRSALLWKTSQGGSTRIKTGERRVGQFVGSVAHVLTWHRVIAPPWDAIRAMRGRVNNATFLGHEPETVLFTGLTGQRQYQVNGDRMWSLTYTFLARDQLVWDPNGSVTHGGKTFTWLTWNHFPRQITDATTQSLWQRLVRRGTSDKYVYGTSDLGGLFKPRDSESNTVAAFVDNN